jgi:hypothetical protein
VKGDQYWSAGKRRWLATKDVGMFSGSILTYRRKTDAKAASTKFDLGEKLAQRAHERAKALQMSTPAYVRQCVLTELTKSQRSTVTSGEDAPAMNGAKKDYGCGKGYRWVGPTETLRFTDEVQNDGVWRFATGIGFPAGTSRLYRRKV